MKYDVSIIYVYYNTPHELIESVKSLKDAVGDLTYEVIIVDNDSPKKIPLRVVKNRKVKVVKNQNNGYGAGLNLGVKNAKGKNFILANPDIIFGKHSIKNLSTKLKDKKVGLVGPQILGQDNQVLPSISGKPTLKALIFGTSIIGKLFPNTRTSKKFWLPDRNRSKEQEVKVIGGACMAVKKSVFEELGGFDEQFFMYFEENDICMRAIKRGYRIVYYPKAKIVHLVGRSLKNIGKIEDNYQKSRFLFMKKYNPLFKAIIAETFFRMTTMNGLILACAFVSSLFLNLYILDTHMLFIGDFGRDYLVARDMIVDRIIPLVGIPSSVVWLHQGPLSIYFIALSLFIGKFNPVSPAIFYALIGSITVLLVYKIANMWFGKRVAALSAIFYATSPLVIVSARMPYHTSSIPFFATLFFIFMTLAFKGQVKYIFLSGLTLGLLLQLELSNAVLFILIFLLFLLIKPKFSNKKITFSVLGFLLGIIPFIIYDLTNRFIQTVGLPLWIINRVRLFLGIATSDNTTSTQLPDAFLRILQQYAGIVFPENTFVVLTVSIFVAVFFIQAVKSFKKIKQITGKKLLFLWLTVPLFGFLIHAAPGVAYFPLLFPAVVIIIAYGFNLLSSSSKVLTFGFIAICFLNAYFLVANEYYISTSNSQRGFPPFNYRYGIAIELQKEAVDAIAHDANGKKISLKGGGFIGTLTTGINNYQYLLWTKNVNIDANASTVYTLYEDKNAVKDPNKLIFENGYVFVTKNENL